MNSVRRRLTAEKINPLVSSDRVNEVVERFDPAEGELVWVGESRSVLIVLDDGLYCLEYTSDDNPREAVFCFVKDGVGNGKSWPVLRNLEGHATFSKGGVFLPIESGASGNRYMIKKLWKMG